MQLLSEITCPHCGTLHHSTRSWLPQVRYTFGCKACHRRVSFNSQSIRWLAMPPEIEPDEPARRDAAPTVHLIRERKPPRPQRSTVRMRIKMPAGRRGSVAAAAG
ncbi:MAG: hypothetical protein KC503_29100 [Myxococcales bacterium]|nr:hypothetical protein [Myxococcales bacterium]